MTWSTFEWNLNIEGVFGNTIFSWKMYKISLYSFFAVFDCIIFQPTNFHYMTWFSLTHFPYIKNNVQPGFLFFVAIFLEK